MKRFNIINDDLTSKYCEEIMRAHEREDIIIDIEYFPRLVTIENNKIKVVHNVFELEKEMEAKIVENDFTKLIWIDSDGDRKWEVVLEFSNVDFVLEDTYTKPCIWTASREVTHLVFRIKRKDGFKFYRDMVW